MTLPTGAHLNRYEILSKLGEGGMGEVFLAEDTSLRRKIALKVLRSDSTSDDRARMRLIREAQAAAALEHPNICAIYEVGESDGQTFISMQYVQGETLDTYVKHKSIDLPHILNIAIQVADALAEAHSLGIIHRDIKPANIMITARGSVKVMDFGLAKVFQQAEGTQSEAETVQLISTQGAIIGTLPYMSPEQVRGEMLDGRSDIFSFGVVVYELLTGQQPFAQKSSAATASAILTADPPPLARFAKELPTELERIVSKALRKEVDERYQTIKDLLLDLRSLKDELDFQHRLERSSSSESYQLRPASTAEHADTAVLAATMKLPGTPTVVSGSAVTTGESGQSFKWKWLVGIAALVIVGVVGWLVWRTTNMRWAKRQIPHIEELAQSGNYFEAYDLAVSVQRYIGEDETLGRLMPTISNVIAVNTDPAGAQVYLKRFTVDQADKAPKLLQGTTPINNLRIARGDYILYIEKEGYSTSEHTISGALLHAGNLVVVPPPIRIEQKLFRPDQIQNNMVFVPGGDYRLVAWARPTDTRVRLDDFFIDKYEVSNREYQEFINAGGYLKRQYWKYPFVKDGKTLSWEEATNEFKDRTGLAAPRTWTNQKFPDGKADYPVTDISWYEAAAYADFRGKELPTLFQWEKAARNGQVSALASFMPWGFFYPGDTVDQRANFDSKGTVPVNSLQFGMSRFGAYNMAGNVSEWTRNDSSEGFIATGGGWGDPLYTFAQYGMFPGFYSSDKRGFRCSLNTSNSTGDQGAAKIEIARETPVYTASSQADFRKWAVAYQYDNTALDAQIVEVKETDEWRREKITFNGSGNQRAIAYLYLPKNYPRPLQVVNVVPAGDVANGLRSLSASIEDRLAPIIKSGRAVFGVVLEGYIERLRPPGYEPPDPRTAEYREMVVNRITDVRRGLDYLDTRSDLDHSRIALFAPSAGSIIGLILGAVENRYAAVLLQGAGVVKSYLQTIPEANPINFAPHIAGKKLMLHGRYDEDTALKTQAEPLFKLLSEPKRLVLFEGGHIPQTEVFVTNLNAFFDETLGPAKRE
jgi:serine/threonine protein kinase/formylglycine-generating enzyme required for sulfatase activity